MKMKAYTTLEVMVGALVIILLVGYGIFLTADSFYKTKERLNKDNIAKIHLALKSLADNKTNFEKTFSDCLDYWCEIDKGLTEEKFLNDLTDPPTKLLPIELKTSSGQHFLLKITGKSSYVVQGASAKSPSLCWIISDDETQINTAKVAPSRCLE